MLVSYDTMIANCFMMTKDRVAWLLQSPGVPLAHGLARGLHSASLWTGTSFTGQSNKEGELPRENKGETAMEVPGRPKSMSYCRLNRGRGLKFVPAGPYRANTACSSWSSVQVGCAWRTPLQTVPWSGLAEAGSVPAPGIWGSPGLSCLESTSAETKVVGAPH